MNEPSTSTGIRQPKTIADLLKKKEMTVICDAESDATSACIESIITDSVSDGSSTEDDSKVSSIYWKF